MWLASSFCALHRVVFDPALFAQRYPDPLDESSLARAARELNLSFEHRACSLESALAWRLPLAVQVRSSPTDAGPLLRSGLSYSMPASHTSPFSNAVHRRLSRFRSLIFRRDMRGPPSP